MSEIIHWEQMETFDLETALRLMARDTLANFVWDHWAKCQQVERLLAQYNDSCALLLEKNDRIAEQNQTIEGLQTNANRNGVLQGTVQHHKQQVKALISSYTLLEDELGKAYKVIKALQEKNERLNTIVEAKRGVEQ